MTDRLSAYGYAFQIKVITALFTDKAFLQQIADILSASYFESEANQWLIDTTEKWCRDRAIYLALMESIKIADGQDEKKSRDSIPAILQEALAIGFDSHIGHDYLKDYLERYESYHRKEDKIPFDLEYFNKITKGGLPNKTLNIALAGCVHPETKVKIRFRKLR